MLKHQPVAVFPAEGKPSAGKALMRSMRYVAVVMVTVIGLALLMYPSAAQWLYLWQQSKTTAAYVQQAHEVQPQTRADLLANATAYNAALPLGPLLDFSYLAGLTNPDNIPSMDYSAQLAVDDTSIMGRLVIPSINVDLPIYHGDTDDVLALGVGHIASSSLPIGGPSTHAVLTGHSGYANAPLLTDLPKVVLGDTFEIEVLGESLYYQVDDISVVLPDDLSKLQIIEGEDLVTLVTCTPKWVNTYRLLVRGVRIPAPTEGTPDGQVMGPGVLPGIPWWLVVIVTGAVASGFAARWWLKPIKRKVSELYEPRHGSGADDIASLFRHAKRAIASRADPDPPPVEEFSG